MPLQAVITAQLKTTRFYLTDRDTASDIPGNARLFPDLSAASLVAGAARRDPSWAPLLWEPAYLMSDGTLCYFEPSGR